MRIYMSVCGCAYGLCTARNRCSTRISYRSVKVCMG